MKINNINKKDLISTSIEQKKETIEITSILVEDIEDEDLSLIMCFGDDDNPVDMNFLNRITHSVTYLLSLNSANLQSVPNKIVFTVPENIPLFYPQAQEYDLEESTWGEFMDKIEANLDLLDDNWFFISVGLDKSEDDLLEALKELKSRYPAINGIIVRPKIQIFYE